MWQKYKMRVIINDKYRRVRRRQTKEGFNSLSKFVAVVCVFVLVIKLLPIALAGGTIWLMAFIIRKTVKHRRNKELGPEPPPHQQYQGYQQGGWQGYQQGQWQDYQPPPQ